MSVPKSVTKVSRDGSVTFTSNVDAVQYYIEELKRGALRDVGKFLAKQYRLEFYKKHQKQSYQVGKGTGYWARKRESDLQIGIARKGKGFWGMIFEIGSSTIKKENTLRDVTYNNIDKIIEIESQYLSELSKDKPDLTGLSEGDYEGE